MFCSPFPPSISFVCKHSSSIPTNEIKILQEEEEYLKQVSSEKRKQEFMLGRACAYTALSQLKSSSLKIPKDKKTGEPIWPKGIVGSITHSTSWFIVAAAYQKDIKALGVDLESIGRSINEKIQPRICVETEEKWLNSFSSEEKALLLKVIFSAKESIFKCFYPLTRTYLDFHDAEISIDHKSESFQFTLLKACSSDYPKNFQYQGTYQIKGGMIFTAIYLI